MRKEVALQLIPTMFPKAASEKTLAVDAHLRHYLKQMASIAFAENPRAFTTGTRKRGATGRKPLRFQCAVPMDRAEGQEYKACDLLGR